MAQQIMKAPIRSMTQNFVHIFERGDAAKPTLLLLHGTGGDERNLLDLGRGTAPDVSLLSVRGKVLENGMPRFFRRLAEGVFDLEDLRLRTDELADFIAEAKQKYGIGKLIALGYSNGANIAASLLLQRPEALDGAMLLRATVPFSPPAVPDLSGKNILMLSGLMDPIIPADNSRLLAAMFEKAGAKIEHNIAPVGHNLVQGDFTALKEWFAAL
jgi:phospholipase/carboxylesterase